MAEEGGSGLAPTRSAGNEQMVQIKRRLAELPPLADAVPANGPGTQSANLAWLQAVQEIRSSPELRDEIVRSVLTSMRAEGFDVDREWSERALDEALAGPPLEYPGQG